jgi:hypothetical protein
MKKFFFDKHLNKGYFQRLMSSNPEKKRSAIDENALNNVKKVNLSRAIYSLSEFAKKIWVL